jgi:hypothetical protein
MRLAAHVHQAAKECIIHVLRMQRLNLRVLSLGEVVDVVALNCLVEKGKAQRQYEQDDD